MKEETKNETEERDGVTEGKKGMERDRICTVGGGMHQCTAMAMTVSQ